MKKTLASPSAFFHPRIFTAFILCSMGAWLAMFSFAGTPSSGTLTTTNTVLTYDAGPFNVPNQTPAGLGQLDVGPRCDDTTFQCDIFALTVTVPAGYAAAHPNAGIKVTLFWTDTGTSNSQTEYDLYVYNGVVTTLDGSQPSNHASTGANPEVTTINPVVDGTNQYSVIIVPYTPTHETVHGRIELLPGDSGVNPNFGAADPTTPGIPRYHIFEAPAGSTADASQGEFNIGFDPITHRIMVMNIGPIWRLTPPEILTPAKPECCEALWEDKSNDTTNIGLDPILWTDQKTGRTFVSNSTAGANAVYGYTDAAAPFNDGDQWVSFAPSSPNFSDDHETLGSGPYPAALSTLGTPVNQGEAVYYCGQTFPVGSAECQRSDTLGASFGSGVPAYNGTNSNCGGLHGHVRVAPDGTVWLPVKKCGNLGGDAQGGALSTTAGATWTEFMVAGSHSQPQGADPSIGIDTDSTVYYAYVNNEPVATGNPPEGHAHVQVSKNGGQSWIRDFDLGASHGIRNVVEIEAVGGSSGRAAVGFLGSDVNGDYQSVTFPGKWYVFIATTYDQGRTWTTVNATPNDPVQSRTGVWQQGGNQPDRNLLDFNEITTDDKGRVLYGYSDGCVTPDCIAGAAQDDFVADMRVARQSGGKTLLASYDANTDTTTAKIPKPACLSGARDPLSAHLSWKVPDNGGADITSYEIWRGTTSGGEQKVFTTNSPKDSFIDSTTTNNTGYDPTAPDYYYYVKAINSVGVGTQSNEIHLVIIVPPPAGSFCVAPGVTMLADPQGDTSLVLGLVSTPAPPGADLKSFQLAQPYQADGIPRLIFTLNTWDNGQMVQPTGSAWYVAMVLPGPDPTVPGDTSTVHYRGVHMIWNGPTPTFESYIPGGNRAGGVDGRFTGTVIGPAESGSYAAPFNQVVITVKASDLGLKPGDVISGFLSGVAQNQPPPANDTAVPLYDQMPDSLSYANGYVVNFNSICAATSPGVVSRRMHGAAGPFDIALPAAPNPAGIECRVGGANSAYTLVYTFGSNLGFPGTATVTQGSGDVTSTLLGPNLNQITVSLIHVTTAQHLIVTLAGAEDSTNVTLPSVAARMDVLVGDVNASGNVDAADVGQVQRQNNKPITSSNFRADVNVTGNIDAADVGQVQRQNSKHLP